jgi:MerR family transcriptional regulator/heat shock protein HspR
MLGEVTKGIFAISVAAEMVGMPIQNLRVYERRGLDSPQRTPGGTRLYSHADIQRLHRIRELLAEGLNLAGIAQVVRLEGELQDHQEAGPRRTKPPR